MRICLSWSRRKGRLRPWPLASGANLPAAAGLDRRRSTGVDLVRLTDLDLPLAQLGPEPLGPPLTGAQTAGA